MSPKNEEGKVQIHWRRTGGEPSAAWRRLWARLLADRKTTEAGTPEAADNGEMSNEKDGNLSHE